MSTITTHGVRRTAVLGVLAASALAAWANASAQQAGPAEAWHSNADWAAEYGCSECPAAWNVAQSAEEAAWLHRNGFPSRSEQARLSKLDDAALRAQFDAGNLSAGAVLMDRMIAQRRKGAASFVMQLAARGSVYALYRDADMNRRIGGHFYLPTAAAMVRVAELRGDRRAPKELALHIPSMTPSVNAGEASIVDEYVAVALRILEEDRRKYGYPPLTIDIRPLPPQAQQTAMVGPGG
jgi:hypothetical protein